MTRTKWIFIGIVFLVAGYMAFFMGDTRRHIVDIYTGSFRLVADDQWYHISIDAIAWDDDSYSSVVNVVADNIVPGPVTQLTSLPYLREPSKQPSTKESYTVPLVFYRLFEGETVVVKPNTLFVVFGDGTSIEKELKQVGIADLAPYQNSTSFVEQLQQVVAKLAATHEDTIKNKMTLGQ